MNFNSFFDYPVKDDSHATEPSEQFVFLPGWSDNDWGKLLQHTQTQLYESGEVVIHAGDAEQTLYMLADGSLEVVIQRRGKPIHIATIEAGSVIGEQSFLDGQARSASVVATAPCQIMQLTRDAFEIFAAREPRLSRALLFDLGRILSLRLRRVMSDRSLGSI